MSFKVYVDGQSGTTGLQIHERLARYKDIEVLEIDPDKRRDPEERRRFLNEADLVFLCLPDDAARESVALIENPATRVIDASTAHRVAEGWVYGLPELAPGQREKIRTATRVAVTGCHAAASILALRPLREAGLMPADYPVVIHSVTGYSGGGKGMIAQYEEGAEHLKSPRHYALGLTHKHLPEIAHYGLLEATPSFLPIIGDYYKGLAVSLPLHTRLLNKPVTVSSLNELYRSYYAGEDFIDVLEEGAPVGEDAGFLNVRSCNETNRADVIVAGNDELPLVVVRLDNLGKGASGAAVQCMNLMLGLDEQTQLAVR